MNASHFLTIAIDVLDGLTIDAIRNGSISDARDKEEILEYQMDNIAEAIESAMPQDTPRLVALWTDLGYPEANELTVSGEWGHDSTSPTAHNVIYAAVSEVMFNRLCVTIDHNRTI